MTQSRKELPLRERLIDIIVRSGMEEYLVANGRNYTRYFETLADSLIEFVFMEGLRLLDSTSRNLIRFLVEHSSLVEICRREKLSLEGYDQELVEEFTALLSDPTAL